MSVESKCLKGKSFFEALQAVHDAGLEEDERRARIADVVLIHLPTTYHAYRVNFAFLVRGRAYNHMFAAQGYFDFRKLFPARPKASDEHYPLFKMVMEVINW